MRLDIKAFGLVCGLVWGVGTKEGENSRISNIE